MSHLSLTLINNNNNNNDSLDNFAVKISPDSRPNSSKHLSQSSSKDKIRLDLLVEQNQKALPRYC